MNSLRSVYIIDGCRTPFLKVRGKVGPFSAADLGVAAGQTLLERQPFSPTNLGEVITGCMLPRENEANISRIISLRLGCGKKIPAWTVQRNCASGMQAIDSAMKDIMLGRHDLVLAGGTDAMSHAPVMLNDDLVNYLTDWAMAKTFGERLKLLTHLRPKFFKPIIGLLNGLTDPIVGLSMGQTAENLAYEFHITREMMDEFALRSHQRWAEATKQGFYSEITPMADANGNIYATDTGARPDTTLKKLASLPPFFDKKFGLVTAGNSSQVTDGAAFVVLASKEAVDKYQLPVLGKIVDIEWAGVDPARMGLGPAYAVPPLLQRNKLSFKDIEYWEINEAFAAQVLACLAVWSNAEYCRENLGLPDAFGEVDPSRLNVDGGAIAIGHPIGATGTRITYHLLKVLRRNQARYGVATLCIGGGQGGAILVEQMAAAE